jgi:hypothetical protein
MAKSPQDYMKSLRGMLGALFGNTVQMPNSRVGLQLLTT